MGKGSFCLRIVAKCIKAPKSDFLSAYRRIILVRKDAPMPPEIRIHSLDNRSLDSFFEHVPLGPKDYRREPEPQIGRKQAISFEMIVLILSVPTVLSGLAAWLAHHGNDVDLEISAGKARAKWRIRPGKRKAEAIQAELENAVRKVQRAEIAEQPASPQKAVSRQHHIEINR
jgi:hypothetical protein